MQELNVGLERTAASRQCVLPLVSTRDEWLRKSSRRNGSYLARRQPPMAANSVVLHPHTHARTSRSSMPIAWSNGCSKLAAITALPVPEPCDGCRTPLASLTQLPLCRHRTTILFKTTNVLPSHQIVEDRVVEQRRCDPPDRVCEWKEQDLAIDLESHTHAQVRLSVSHQSRAIGQLRPTYIGRLDEVLALARFR